MKRRLLKHLIGIFIFGVAALIIFALVPGINWLRAVAVLVVGICASLARDFVEQAF